jgi:hypothetical protein
VSVLQPRAVTLVTVSSETTLSRRRGQQTLNYAATSLLAGGWWIVTRLRTHGFQEGQGVAARVLESVLPHSGFRLTIVLRDDRAMSDWGRTTATI